MDLTELPLAYSQVCPGKGKTKSDIIFGYAGVAQTVEQLIRNEKVEGSIPFTGTSIHAGHSNVARFRF